MRGFCACVVIQGERNFHILYELVAGATQCGLAKELKVCRTAYLYSGILVLCRPETCTVLGVVLVVRCRSSQGLIGWRIVLIVVLLVLPLLCTWRAFIGQPFADPGSDGWGITVYYTRYEVQVVVLGRAIRDEKMVLGATSSFLYAKI